MTSKNSSYLFEMSHIEIKTASTSTKIPDPVKILTSKMHIPLLLLDHASEFQSIKTYQFTQNTVEIFLITGTI